MSLIFKPIDQDVDKQIDLQIDQESILQLDITRVCIESALLVLQHGAESALIEQLSTRLGIALGADRVESSITANAIVLTTIIKGKCKTSTRRNIDRGINMQVITEVQKIVIMAENSLLDIQEVTMRLQHIKPLRYPRALVIVVVGLSCACFCLLNKGDYNAAFITFVASSSAMFIRLILAGKQINPLINFCISAFIATSISGLLLSLRFFEGASNIAMAASILLLVPGFPLINAVSDMFKGHVNTGLARWIMASLLALSTCIGVVSAISLWGLQSWA